MYQILILESTVRFALLVLLIFAGRGGAGSAFRRAGRGGAVRTSLLVTHLLAQHAKLTTYDQPPAA